MYVVVLPPDDFDSRYGFFTGGTYGMFDSIEEAQEWAKSLGISDTIQISLVQDKNDPDWI